MNFKLLVNNDRGWISLEARTIFKYTITATGTKGHPMEINFHNYNPRPCIKAAILKPTVILTSSRGIVLLSMVIVYLSMASRYELRLLGGPRMLGQLKQELCLLMTKSFWVGLHNFQFIACFISYIQCQHFTMQNTGMDYKICSYVFTLMWPLAFTKSPRVVWRVESAPRGTISFSFSRQWRRWALLQIQNTVEISAFVQ